jgi:FkbM family methyltransferase
VGELTRRAQWVLASVLAAAWRRVPIHGPGRVMEPLFLRRSAALGDGMVKGDGFKLLVDFRNPPESAWFLWRRYEDDAQTAIAAALEPGMTAVDVGANSGLLTLFMRRAVGAGGRVLSIDPSSEACERVRQQLAANGFDNVDVVTAALGERDGVERYFHAEIGIGALPATDRQHTTDASEEVHVTSLDALLAERGAGEVGFVKIDTDGAELGVLRGARRTIERDHPVLLFEINGPGLARRGHDPAELGELLDELGYDVLAPVLAGDRGVRPDRVARFEPVRLSSLGTDRDAGNFVALPRTGPRRDAVAARLPR